MSDPTVSDVYDVPSGAVAVVVDNHDGAGWCVYWWSCREDYTVDMLWRESVGGPIGGDLVSACQSGHDTAESATRAVFE